MAPLIKTHNKKVIAHKELAEAYGVNVHTLSAWLKKIPGLELKKRNSLYAPKQQEIIYSHLGSPFE